MNAITAIIRHGRIEAEGPINLPEGTRLSLFAPVTGESPDTNDDFDEEWDCSPEGIAARSEWYKNLQMEIAEEDMGAQEVDELRSEAWLRQCNQYAIAKMAEDVKDLFP